MGTAVVPFVFRMSTLQTTGRMQDLEARYLDKPTPKTSQVTFGISLTHLQGIFIMVLAGAAVSFLTLVLELVYCEWKNKTVS